MSVDKEQHTKLTEYATAWSALGAQRTRFNSLCTVTLYRLGQSTTPQAERRALRRGAIFALTELRQQMGIQQRIIEGLKES